MKAPQEAIERGFCELADWYAAQTWAVETADQLEAGKHQDVERKRLDRLAQLAALYDSTLVRR